MTEKQRYVVLDGFAGFELRHYPAHLRAEIEVDGTFSDAANRAFGTLAAYISGRNDTATKVAMTAPVVQEPVPASGATATVVMPAGEPDRHVIGFIMPAGYNHDTLPAPTDARITVRDVPEQLVAARAFTGRWTEPAYDQHLATLEAAVAEAGFRPVGQPQFARFDPPWTPWFLRRNEVLMPVAADGRDGA